MSSRKNGPARSRWQGTLLLLVSSILLLVISLLSWQALREGMQDQLDDESHRTALIAARNAEIEFQGSAQSLERMSVRLQAFGAETGEYASQLLYSHPEISQIVITDIQLEPLKTFSADSASEDSGKAADSSVLISTVYPIVVDKELKGYLIGYVDILKVIEEVFADYQLRFGIRVLKNDTALLEIGDWTSADRVKTFVEPIVLNEYNRMTLEVAPLPDYRASELLPSWFALLLMLMITAAVIVLILVTMKNRALSSLNLRQYREMLENVDLVSVIISSDGILEFCNRYLLELSGYRKQELLNRSIFTTLLSGQPAAGQQALLQRIQEGRIRTHREILMTGKDGRERLLKTSCSLRRDTMGKIIGIACIAEDITEQRLIDQKLFLQSSALSSAADGIAILGLDECIRWVNHSLLQMIGYEEHEVLGRTFKELLRSGAHDAEFYQSLYEIPRSGIVWRGEIINRRKDGSLYDEYMTITPVRDDSGQIAHFIAIMRDITEQKELERKNRELVEQLGMNQRIDSLGKLAGGIAHDFNNLLVPIIGYAEIGELQTQDTGLQETFSIIREAGEKASSLTRQILAFSRKQELTLEVVDLCEVLSGIEPMLSRLIGEDIEMSWELHEESIPVRADKGQLEQIVINLAVNARDAMPDGGRLSISTRVNDHSGEPAAELLVDDTGVGMSDEVRRHIFEPFFTTKASGSGTGLGLSTVFGIVDQHGGTIRVDSQQGVGSRFIISFPLIEAEPSSPPKEVPRDRVLYGGEHVAVVEDNLQVLQMVESVLRSHGYTVTSFDDPGKGLEALGSGGLSVDMILSDIIMPRIDGLTMVKKIWEHQKDIPVLFMSGYTNSEIDRHMEDFPDLRLLRKPFSVDTLLQEVRRTFDEQSRGNVLDPIVSR